MEHLLTYLMAAFCIAAVTFTIAVTSVFEPVRNLVSKVHIKLDQLIHCPWCQSFYGLLVLMITWDVPVTKVTGIPWFNFLFTLFAIYGVIGVIHFVLLRTYEPIARMQAEREMERRREKQRKREAEIVELLHNP